MLLTAVVNRSWTNRTIMELTPGSMGTTQPSIGGFFTMKCVSLRGRMVIAWWHRVVGKLPRTLRRQRHPCRHNSPARIDRLLARGAGEALSRWNFLGQFESLQYVKPTKSKMAGITVAGSVTSSSNQANGHRYSCWPQIYRPSNLASDAAIARPTFSRFGKMSRLKVFIKILVLDQP